MAYALESHSMDNVYNLSIGPLLTFWTIDFNPVVAFDPVSAGVLQLSSYKSGSNEIVYDGVTFSYVGIEGSNFSSEINGQLPQPEISIDKNSLKSLQQYKDIQAAYQLEYGKLFFDWRGARVTRTRITLANINDPSKAETSSFIIDQLKRTTDSTIDLKLTVSITSDRINNLAVQELAPNRCSLRYRSWNGVSFDYLDEDSGGCPYGNPTTQSDWTAVPNFGTGLFTEGNATTTNEALDVCPYTLKGCQVRFDPNEDGLRLPFTGVFKNVTNDSSKDSGSV